MPERIPVAVLGATGSVGQRFVQLLGNHPWFQVVALTGSDRKTGQAYRDACRWVLPEPMPEWAAKLQLTDTDAQQLRVPIVFSALPTGQALVLEPQFAQAGIVVCSNASAFRMEPDVPILLPEVNPDHANLVRVQRQVRGWPGCIVTNSNCTSTGMTVALNALQSISALRRVFVVSLQALSGAGYPGVPSLDILDNVIPYIDGEEDKVEWEPRKMLGSEHEGRLTLADFEISAHTNRVAVSDGHLVCLSIELETPVSVEDARSVMESYRAPEISRDLPSAPAPVLVVRDELDRPQPRLDRMTGRGMSTVVGRLRSDPIFHLKMVVLSHNTVRGAAAVQSIMQN